MIRVDPYIHTHTYIHTYIHTDKQDIIDVGRFMIRVDPGDVRDLCVGELPPEAKRSEKAVTSITLEELKRLRGEA